MSVLESLRGALARASERVPGFTEAMTEAALQEILSALGGEKIWMPKTTQGRRGRPAVPTLVQEAVYRDALRNEPTEQIVRKHGIGRSTLYRLIKRGPRVTGD